VVVWPEVEDELVAELRNAITALRRRPEAEPRLRACDQQQALDRLAKFLDNGTVAIGGDGEDADERSIAPTVLVDVSAEAPIIRGGIRPDHAGARDRRHGGGHRLRQRAPRGVLYLGASIDPGVKYPPYSEHVRERVVRDKLM
jgi:hypothetical protein